MGAAMKHKYVPFLADRNVRYLNQIPRRREIPQHLWPE